MNYALYANEWASKHLLNQLINRCYVQYNILCGLDSKPLTLMSHFTCQFRAIGSSDTGTGLSRNSLAFSGNSETAGGERDDSRHALHLNVSLRTSRQRLGVVEEAAQDFRGLGTGAAGGPGETTGWTSESKERGVTEEADCTSPVSDGSWSPSAAPATEAVSGSPLASPSPRPPSHQ